MSAKKSIEKSQSENPNFPEWWYSQFDRAELALQDALLSFLPFCDLGENNVKNYFIFEIFTKF